MNKVELIELLRNGAVSLSFVKKDGTDRDMLATLKEEYIPSDLRPKGDSKPIAEESPVVRAFDLEIGAWRSINSDSTTIIFDNFPWFANS